MTTEPIIVTDTDDLQRKFRDHIFESVLGITLVYADRLAVELVEVLRANCPPDIGLPVIRRQVAMEIGERGIVAPADVEAMPTGAVDLMAALRASLDRAKAARTGGIIGEFTKTEG